MMGRGTVARKLVISSILAVVAWVGSGLLGFPHVFQVMFVIYVGLGLLVFLLLDAPALGRFSGWNAVWALLGFYIVLSGVYIFGATILPQYDPAIEKGKIEKILKPRLKRLLAEKTRVEKELTQVKSLETQTQMLFVRLNAYVPAPVIADEPERGPISVVDRGREVYELYECYNCHKIGGQGSVKKRGPILDNIGSFLTVEDVKRKIFDPTYLYAEGFEKEHKKGRMPDTYKDLMTDEEVTALATYLSTLKNPEANTPKPVFVKSNVQHGFTVFGYVRDVKGRPAVGVEVHAMPQKKGGHGASAKTNDSGYYEIFIHMHNEDVGVSVTVTAQSATGEFVAEYDPSDKVTKRQQSVDLVLPVS
ncbi:MAG: c-type cytochrome [Nitrospirales bacterium]|nr:c-type cytochrome [Nitrospirales bacterium]